MSIAYADILTGFFIGAVVSLGYFAALACTVHRALRRRAAAQVLIASAVLRLTVFLAVGWAVLTQGGPGSFLGYALAFLLVRMIVVARARRALAGGPAR